MSISIISIAYNGYGKFIDKFLEKIKEQTIKPNEVILVLGKDHNYNKELRDVKVVYHNEEASKGYLLNLGLKYSTSDYNLCFDIDDELLPNAIEEINKVDADIISLTYTLNGNIQQTPIIEKDKINEWRQYYSIASGYLAIKKGLFYEDTLCCEWALLYKSFKDNLVHKNTTNVCAVYRKRNDGYGSNINNINKGFNELQKYANKYLISR